MAGKSIIKFVISMSFDARSRVAFFEAPGDWDDMTQAQRDEFLEEELETWRHEEMETAHQVYASEEEARKDDHGWGSYFSEAEERW